MARGESERATGIGASDDESIKALNKAFDLRLNSRTFSSPLSLTACM